MHTLTTVVVAASSFMHSFVRISSSYWVAEWCR